LSDLNFDEYENKIYNYVLKNPDCNQNDIRNSGVCSPIWALEKLKGLVKNGHIEDRRIGKAFHKYRVNDRKQYRRIKKQLELFDTLHTSMKKPLDDIAKLQDVHGPTYVGGYVQKFVIPYYESMFAMLFRLLKFIETDTEIGKEDSINLRSQIISLIFEVCYQQFYDSDYKKILTRDKNLLNKMKQEQSELGTIKILSVDILDNFVKKIEKFEEQFD